MSTESTPRNRRASRRSSAAADQSSTPSPSPNGAARKSRSRPSLGSTSTTSSASSKLSETFDVNKTVLARPESPTTLTCETTSLRGKFVVLDSGISAHTSNLSISGLLPLRQEVQNDGSPPHPPNDNDMPLRLPRKRSSIRNSQVLIAQQRRASVAGNRLTPGSMSTRQQRASSAPTLPITREDSVDPDRLPVPGSYDSQGSNPEPENNREAEQHVLSIYMDETQTHTISSHSSRQSDDEMEDSSAVGSDAETSVRIEPSIDDVPDQAPFIPYTYEKGQPNVRKIRGERSLNGAILELIQMRRKECDKPGWVYIAESKEHGSEKLKIGCTGKSPAERLDKLRECNLELNEISLDNENPIYHFKFVEQVVFLELGDHRMKLRCHHRDGRIHLLTEWFEIDHEKALKSVETWFNWVLIQEPFDSEGKLTPYWQWRAKTIECTIANVNWQTWTQPPEWNFYLFVIKAHLAQSRKDSWFWAASVVVTVLSFLGHGGRGAFWAMMALLLL